VISVLRKKPSGALTVGPDHCHSWPSTILDDAAKPCEGGSFVPQDLLGETPDGVSLGSSR
jgi:hypothetical protein